MFNKYSFLNNQNTYKHIKKLLVPWEGEGKCLY